MSKSRKKSSHDSHDPTRGVYRSGWWPTTDVDGAEPTAMEAGVHHGRGTTPAPAHAVHRRVGSSAGGDRAPSGDFSSLGARRLSAVTRRAEMGFGSTDISRAWGSRIWWWTHRASK